MQNPIPSFLWWRLSSFSLVPYSTDLHNANVAKALLELAQRLDLDFDAERIDGIPGRFGFLKQLDQGDNRYATNVLSGTYQQNEILAFDYHYQTHSTD